jgi:hypothetical protein
VAIDSDRRAVLRRALGYERNGEVFVRNFDQGMVETMGGTLRYQDKVGVSYFMDIEGVAPPPDMPGIPISFTQPEDVHQRTKMPWVSVARDDISTAIQRWHPGMDKYRTPARGALPAYLEGNLGFDAYETQLQSEPVDISYTVTVSATRRSGYASNALEKMWNYMRKVWKPYGLVIVKDSIGDLRTYNAFRESEYDATEVLGVSDRVASMGFSIRVEGELDIEDPVVSKAVRRRLTTRFRMP